MRERHFLPQLAASILIAALLILPTTSSAFSVLAHQALVDQTWKSQLVPLIQKRFPSATEQDLDDARAYARAGSHIQDLGYFPLGNREFSDLLHYVRTGDFVSRLLAEASSPQEYAFALGVMAHYEADSVGHPLATNLAVPILHPDLKEQYGDSVTYADSPSAHLQTEFRFDILQVAHRHEIPDLFDHSIEFKVPRDSLERAVKETYGLGLDDLFENYDIAVTTYRFGFRTLINEATGIAWQLYREDIDSLEPGVVEKKFLHVMPRGDFEQEFGKAFLEPGYFARFIGWVGSLVPAVGPLEQLPYKPLPHDVKLLYFGAYQKASEQYQRELAKIPANRLELQNLNLDTGLADKPGVYPPADQAWASLLRIHAKDLFARMPKDLTDGMTKHFADRDTALKLIDDEKDRQETSSALNEFESTMKSHQSSMTQH